MLLRFCIITLFAIGISSFPTAEDDAKPTDTSVASSTSTLPPSSSETPSTSSAKPEKDDKDEVTTSSDTTEAETPTTIQPNYEEQQQIPTDWNKYRWDEDTQKYIRLGTTNNCPANMRFFASQTNSTAGHCDCDYYQCSRPLLYSPKTKECHFAWSRGPCEETEWYAFDKEFQPVCETRKCSQGLSEEPVTAQSVTLSFWFTDPHGNDECHEAASDETCEDEDEALLLYPGDPIPKCRLSTVCVPLARPEPQLCFRGNRRYHDGMCP